MESLMESLSPQEKKTLRDKIRAAYDREKRLLPENPTVRDNNRMHQRISRLRKALLKNALEQKLQRLTRQNRNLRLLDTILSVQKQGPDQQSSLLWKLQQQQQQQDIVRKQAQWMLRLLPLRHQTLPTILQQQQQQQQKQDVIKKYLSQKFL
jgi:membrane carboxypeptidase/penicillin-binding protein PbpC